MKSIFHLCFYFSFFTFLFFSCKTESQNPNQRIFKDYVSRTVSISIENEDLLGKKRWSGSGFLISKDGFVLTCAHVIGNYQKKLVVRLGGNGKRYLGKVISSDFKKDISLVALETDDTFNFFDLNEKGKAERGQTYYSISSPLGLEESFTTGIVADPVRVGVDSIVSEISFLQVNQSILPGSSGAALFDVRGNLLGMAQFQLKNSEYNQQGVGFAILPKYLSEFLSSVSLTKFSKEEIQRGIVEVPTITDFLVQNLNLPTREGVLISYLAEKSPAEVSGLKRYDLIVEINGKKISSNEELNSFFKEVAHSERLQIKVIRNRSEKVFYINP
ncbi:S1C family serine protease [Leptospira kanakyensis]|uniref:S1C family serine protease n=1 Tax=Leptospira kanakyensis TaxID=2484968 RepID=UPI00223E865B|nr:trypsin-like peptidase domain-containing protein [Leptospira kanakyensis]MCW7468202.1 S1C family serine protease [Leptospira kanakyensis]MCW7482581.1 S1C family serine protease [Leptospira kanakyensis]